MKSFLQSIFGGKSKQSAEIPTAIEQDERPVTEPAQPATPAQTDLDFSDVDSVAKAQALQQDGKLFKILLFPEALGGQDIPPNTVYVPAGIPEIQNQIIGTILRFAEDGLIDNMNVKPEYKGKSFIPSKITMNTTHEGKTGQFNPTIEIW